MPDREHFASESIPLLATFNGHRLIAHTPIRVRCVDCGRATVRNVELPGPCEGYPRIERLERVEANARGMLGRVADALDLVLERPGGDEAQEFAELVKGLNAKARAALMGVIRYEVKGIRKANGGDGG